MNARTIKLAGLGLALLVLGAATGYGLARRQAGTSTPAATTATAERKPLYWYDPMQPDQHFDKPGKSPFMDMELVPRYADDAAANPGLKIDPAITQNLGMRLARVEQAELPADTVDAVATLQFNDRDVAVMQALSGGFVDRVYARAAGDVVARGAPLVGLRVPEWLQAQEEYLALRHSGDATLAATARERLRNLGMPADLIAEVERDGRPRPVATIAAPIAGVIDSLDIRAGMNVAPGTPLARINGLGTVWLEAAVPEAQAAQVGMGMRAEARFAGFPGEIFTGRVAAVLPDTNRDSHTLRIRVELPNRGARLRPGMFAQLRLLDTRKETALLIPTEALIHGGTRDLVMLAHEGGRFEPVEVTAGRELDGRTVILKGLAAGQQVVASGQFLIDSEASLKQVAPRRDTEEHAHDAAAAMESGRLDGGKP